MPDSSLPTDVPGQLAALRERFVERLGGTLEALVRHADGHALCAETLHRLHAGLHKLVGSGGTFGFPELSRQARILELSAKAWLDAASVPSDAEWAAWRTALHGLHQATAAPAAGGPVVASPAAPPIKQQDSIRIVLIEDDLDYATELSLGLSQFGYEAIHYAGFATAEPAILADPPDALVVDITLTGQTPSDGTLAIPPLFEKMGYRLPTVFLTARMDFTARMNAARAGGDAFLTKPTDAPSVAARIEMLLQERGKAPYRVLIVDDDEILAEHYRLTLSAAGILAEKVCAPQDVLAALANLNPDLILMDLYMPEYSGADLARAIRYDPAWQGVPIVFLSAEEELDKQIQAMESGADDFLVKPLSPQRLASMVKARARRARTIAELMSQDSLTGLLKHASIKDRLAQEVDRAKRQGKPLSVAMADIDFFKQVNDGWGHPMGDQVIKALGQLLRQRLRHQDSIGRYGGEEFAAVLPECAASDAARLLDDVRQRFGEVRFVRQGQSFSVTLSVGIASTDEYPDAQSLLAAADTALYAAKHGGRNQVRCAPSATANQERPS